MKHIRRRVNELLAEKRVAEKSLVNHKQRLNKELNRLEDYQNVQNLFQTAIRLMYDGISVKLGNIITEGLQIVFPDSQYKFCIDFVEKRNTIEAELYLQDTDGHRYDCLEDVGGGVADFISLLLRITYITLSKYDNTLIADEPAKFINRSRIEHAAKFISKVCKDLNFQILMTTHIPSMTEHSNKVYKVEKRKGVSTIKVVK